ncbi:MULTISPECIES: site-specific integrase [Pseudomonas]|uniref:Uncharacterized protein n=1 Tax=Pseudomonas kurunegalensis TaxID=485880 RepID=A0ACC5UHM8_9PSED|nr:MULTISPECIES: site-specific integrase [Pseudomonas]MBC3421866.1 site-specific integrase [Pseudomonas sp. RW3S2]MBV4513870.1 hypothetical protein [Pseudomonas kurunegalensis]
MILTKSEQELGFEHCDLTGNRPMTSFRYLLYVGGAAANQNSMNRLLAAGDLGFPRLERLHLVSLFHGYIERQFRDKVRGTIFDDVYCLRQLYVEYDRLGVDLSVDNIVRCFESYSQGRWEQVLKGVCSISAETAYTQDKSILSSINGALELPPGIVRSAFDYSELRRRGLLGRLKVDKSSSSEGFQFGADLLDVIESFSAESCFGELPLAVNFSDGGSYECWGVLHNPARRKNKAQGRKESARCPNAVRRLEREREKRRVAGDIRSRADIVNLRVHAEFNLFLSQTGFNVSTAYNLPYEDYRCTTIEGGCRIEAYKPRKQSDVEIIVYAEYKDHFLKYLRFLREVYPNGPKYLFPFRSREGKRAGKYRQGTFSKFMKSAQRKCLAANSLRKTRVNWMLRETHDPDFVASEAQHSKRTLVEVYSAPSQEIAFGEWSNFFSKRKLSRESVLDGECTPRSAEPLEGSPIAPDCLNPTGCLFCVYYQGKKSLDYIWSLVTFRYLKYSEFKLIPINMDIISSPQKVVVDRIDKIIEAFSSQDEQCKAWKEEAEFRMLERNFHESYRGLIEVRFNG